MFDVGLQERLLIPSFPACGTLQSAGAIDEGRAAVAPPLAPKADIVLCLLLCCLLLVACFVYSILLLLILGDVMLCGVWIYALRLGRYEMMSDE
jgi:hypothetical protein